MEEKIGKIELRNLTADDYQGLKESMLASYENWTGALWEKKDIARLLQLFPEGQIAILVDEKIAGCALSLIIDYGRFGDSRYSFLPSFAGCVSGAVCTMRARNFVRD